MKREVLDNGAVILSLKRPKDYTSRIIIASRLGSINEPKKKGGLAHLLEHTMLSADIKKISFIKIAEIMDFLGGHQNAKTNYDSIRIYGYTQKPAFEKFSNILMEISLNPVFNSKTFKNEKNIILTELRGYLDDPSRCVSDLFLQALYKKHPIKTSIRNKIRGLKRITMKDIVNNHKTYFSPNNLVVGIFGNFKKRSYNKLKIKLEGFNTKKISNMRISKEDMLPLKKRIVEKRRDMKQVYIQTGVKTTTIDSEDMHALRLISALLTCGDSSRLFNELRLKRGLVYFVRSKNIIGRNFGFFYVKTRTQKQKGKQSLNIIKKVLKGLTTKKVSKKELKKAKNLIVGLRKAEYDNPVEGALRFVKDEIVLGNVNKERENMKKIKKVSEREIQQVAKKYFNEDNFATAIIRPK